MDFAFIDSGMGGIPYMMSLIQKERDRTCVYLGDTAAFPYGNKSPAEVIERALFAVGKAIKAWKPRVAVIACNTMSVHALLALRANFDIPIVGTVPAIRLAAETTKNRRIGFLATDATVAASYSKELSSRYAADCAVFPLGAPDLVRFVEERIADASEKEKEDAVKEAMQYFAKMHCDTIILGCTHFTHLYDAIVRTASSLIPDVKVVDSRDGVARQALKVYHSLAASSPSITPCPPDIAPSFLPPAVYVTGADSIVWRKLCTSLGLTWKGSMEDCNN